MVNQDDLLMQQWRTSYMQNPKELYEYKALRDELTENATSSTNTGCSCTTAGNVRCLMQTHKDLLHAVCDLLLIPEPMFGAQWSDMRTLMRLFSERVTIVIAPLGSFDPSSNALQRIREIDFKEALKMEIDRMNSQASAGNSCEASNSRTRMTSADMPALLQVSSIPPSA
jgi:hypothetical protein